MEKEKRNYVEELENLKTAFLGYDKEAVLTYIQSLFDALEEEQQAFQNAEAETQRALAAENAALQSELQTRKQVYEELVKRVDQLNLSMDASIDKMGSYERARTPSKSIADASRRSQSKSRRQARNVKRSFGKQMPRLHASRQLPRQRQKRFSRKPRHPNSACSRKRKRVLMRS